jgi:hypothetical protein
MWQRIMHLRVRCFQSRKVCGLSPQTSLHWKQRTHKCMIRCHITHHNEIFTILISDFSQEIYVLPNDDMQCAIETCRNSESVLMCIILD